MVYTDYWVCYNCPLCPIIRVLAIKDILWYNGQVKYKTVFELLIQ